MRLRIPFYKQDTDYTCGPVVLQMVLKFLGDFESEKTLAREVRADKNTGTNHEHMLAALRNKGFHYHAESEASISKIKKFIKEGLPVIVNFVEPDTSEGHYAVISGFERGKIVMNDPVHGENSRVGEKDFLGRWRNQNGSSRRWLLVVSKNPITADEA